MCLKNLFIFLYIFLFVPCFPQLRKEYFINPPQCAKPSTYWEWMNGNISKEGITKDLEYMQNANYGEAMIFEAGVGIPCGHVNYNSPLWKDMILHAVKEADRLGIDLMMHNSPGYSGTGGPWIEPKYSMKQVVWADTVVDVLDNRFVSISMPKPFSKLGYYKDAYVLAYPALPREKETFYSLIKSIMIDEKAIDKRILFDKDLSTQIRIEKGQNLIIELYDNYESQSVLVYRGNREKPLDPHDGPRDYPPVLNLEMSNDGYNFSELGNIRCPSLRAMDPPSVLTYNTVNARFYRISSNRGTNLAEINILHYPCLKDFPDKTNSTNIQVSLDNNNQVVGKEWIINPNDVINLTDEISKEGYINCKLPSGVWNIVRIGYTCTGETVAAAPDSGSGLDCDKFSKDALDVHFNAFIDPLLDILRPWCGKALKAFVIDSWEAGKQNWTDDLPEYFKKKRGYDIVSYMLAVTGRIVSSVNDTERFLWDFRRTHADMFMENYIEYFKMHAALYDLKYAGEAYGDGNFESLEMASKQDYPMSEFWTHYIYGNISTTMMASSAAHIWGKKIVPCECYTGTPFNSKFTEHPYGMKALGDYIMCSGVNRFVYHATTHQPYTGSQKGNIMTMGPFGTHFDRNSTWANQFSALNLYNSRCAYVLQQGIHVADILYLKDDAISSGVMNYYQVNPKTPYGYKWDITNSESLIKRINIKDGRIVTSNGMSYKIMVIPSLYRTSPDVLRKLIDLVNAGMNLLLFGESPVGYLGLSHGEDNEIHQLANILWKNQKLGKGRVFLNVDIDNVLSCLNLQPDFRFVSENMDALIHFTHRKVGRDDVYFVSNQRRRRERICIDCRIKNKIPFIWNAENGEVDIPVPYKIEGDRINVNLDLSESASVFVVFKDSVLKEDTDYLDIKAMPTRINTRDGLINNCDTIDWNSTFTIACWCKPETYAAPGRGFVLFPSKGSNDKTKVGFSMGQNGISIYECSSVKTVSLKYNAPIEGWTHVVIVYNKGIPFLYVNGNMITKGDKSKHLCVPAIDEPMSDEQIIAVFEGDNTPIIYYDYPLDAHEIHQLFKKGLEPVRLNGVPIIDLSDGWNVYFPKWSHAPEMIFLQSLMSLHKHRDFNVRHFSGTAIYKKKFYLNEKEYSGIVGKNIMLSLGRVENIAEVSVNGNDTILLWKAPYEINVTGMIKEGENELVIKVTNLYPNRIIGDEHIDEKYEYDKYGQIKELPDWYINNGIDKDRKRVLFIPWKHYKATDPLLESGLLGNAVLYESLSAKR